MRRIESQPAVILWVIFVLRGASVSTALAAPPLPAYNVRPETASISGISSGGFMAVQMHVAYSASFRSGAAIFAGGPFYCAQGSLTSALMQCMPALPSAPSAQDSIDVTQTWEKSGDVDPTRYLAASKVYLFSGKNDSEVKQPVMDSLRDYYLHYISPTNLIYENSMDAEHGWISPDGKNPCGIKASPYVNQCGIDPEKTFLTLFYGPLNPRASGPLGGKLIAFDQREFFDDHDPVSHSMSESGWAYIPTDCGHQAPCRVHMALHGCKQSDQIIGDAFIRTAGLNEWADSNHIIVIYPQTGSAAGNPNSCWDWWGYDSQDYSKKSAPQMTALRRILGRVTQQLWMDALSGH